MTSSIVNAEFNKMVLQTLLITEQGTSQGI